MATETNATLNDPISGKTLELPILEPSCGNPAVAMADLYKKLDYFSYDPGFVATASCQSAITYIDGDKGVLLYRGYPIEQLAEQCSFLEVCYLLLNGELPDSSELSLFRETIVHHTMLAENLSAFFNGFNYDAHPMAMLATVVSSLSAFYNEDLDIHDPVQRMTTAQRLIAKMPTIAAAGYKYSLGQPFVYPCNKLSYCANFLNMMFSVPCEDYAVDPAAERALELLLILHADHEQNASTSTVRLAGSSGTNPYAAIAAGIASLWGPAHGGANEAVLRMLDEIGDTGNIDKYIAKAKDKDDPFRLMGFGHRVYRNFDPRAKIIKGACHEVLSKHGDDPRLELAMRLEEIALEDDYFVEHKLYPNVDFYSGIIYQALGVPRNMFPVMFAAARCVGWIAHWMEMIADPELKIGRPRQLYVGRQRRDVVPMNKRQ